MKSGNRKRASRFAGANFLAVTFTISALLAICLINSCAVNAPLKEAPPVQVYFSPNGGVTQAIINEISNAKTEILVQAYSFTSTPIAKALVDAHKRGVKVEAILDKSQRKETYTEATFLANMGVPTYIDDKHAIAHNKVMIIDKAVVISGSFNFTKAAEEKNAENLLIIKSNELAARYLENWQKHREHSEPYQARY
jgi:phosphatidylserine/phosphatidylglycerophosphate/cardiolipin synthase-like enzyme